MSSVRARITLFASLAVAVVLGVAASLLVLTQQAQLRETLDDGLERRALDAVALLESGAAVNAVVRPRAGDDALVQVVDADGRVLGAWPTTLDVPVAPPEPGRPTTEVGALDGAYRVVTRSAGASVGPVVVHVGASNEDVQEARAVLIAALVLGVPVVALLLAGLVWVLVGRTLAPVEAMRAEVADISGGQLHRRVPEPGTGDEVDRLATTMNAMLDRVEAAAEQQRRFIADASHELRTPITRIRAMLETADEHTTEATLASVLADTVELQRLAEDLLHLARSDAGAIAPPPDEPLDLDDLVLEEVRALNGSATVDTTGVAAAHVRGDAAQLRRVVRNLLDNAARFARSTISVRTSEGGGTAVIEVADDGPGIPPEHRDLVFERFGRVEEARDRAQGGAGLGLSIARDIVARHGGTIEVVDSVGGAHLQVRLPSA